MVKLIGLFLLFISLTGYTILVGDEPLRVKLKTFGGFALFLLGVLTAAALLA